MSEFPGQGYVPPHIPPQHTPRLQRKRREKPPASLSKLHRPLTRFYCNDCKKKFRSRILANRNNNAVQHYCSLYQKIITRKVDSHSNKCKGDHGMGPCVVKRTDNDPDSDGEDETKAAYYADKGKKRPASSRRRGAYTKKRKRDDDDFVVDDINTPNTKRQRRNHNQGPPPPEPIPHYNEYYHPQIPPMIPHLNGNCMPPVYASTPPIPMAIATAADADVDADERMMTHTEHISSRIADDRKYDQVMPPPPALEPISVENTSNGIDINTNGEDPNDSLFVTVSNNGAGYMLSVVEKEEKEIINNNNNKETEKEDDDECINDDNTEDEDDLPDLTVPRCDKQDGDNLDFDLAIPE